MQWLTGNPAYSIAAYSHPGAQPGRAAALYSIARRGSEGQGSASTDTGCVRAIWDRCKSGFLTCVRKRSPRKPTPSQVLDAQSDADGDEQDFVETVAAFWDEEEVQIDVKHSLRQTVRKLGSSRRCGRHGSILSIDFATTTYRRFTHRTGRAVV
ncbi:Uncharacterised protein [Mycobacteroides abscessus subsp. abscessus]|nr:Uncharacterised protein [Mycobacteroides abscessus subsp. abscessus]